MTSITRRPTPTRIGLVATDVDGTLLGPDHRVPAARVDAVARLRRAGIDLVLATGKIWPSIRPLWEQLELDGPHVTCNGAAVVDGSGRVLATTPLDTAVADEVAAYLRRHHVPHAIYLDDGTLVTDELRPELDIVVELGEPAPSVGRPDGRAVLKVLAVVDDAHEGGLRDVADDDARIQRTGPRFLEWNSPDADKATGLLTVVDTLGRVLDEVVAIGDAENDVPMLRAAGFGVAVAAASSAARDHADVHLRSDLTDYLDELAATAERS